MTSFRRAVLVSLVAVLAGGSVSACGGEEEGNPQEQVGCTKDADCDSGKTCNTSTGTCESSDPCNGSCSAEQTCDTTTTPPSCKSPIKSCTGTGHSTCGYGEYCAADVCADAPVAPAECSNFSGSRPEWSAATSTGPVIYEVKKADYQANSAYCQPSAPDAYLVSVRAYRTDADWPATRGALGGSYFYVRADTTQFDVVNAGLLVPNIGYNRNTNDQKDAQFNVYLCVAANTATLPAAFYFTGGNPVCETLAK
jgi:hypothetical protein